MSTRKNVAVLSAGAVYFSITQGRKSYLAKWGLQGKMKSLRSSSGKVHDMLMTLFILRDTGAFKTEEDIEREFEEKLSSIDKEYEENKRKLEDKFAKEDKRKR